MGDDFEIEPEDGDVGDEEAETESGPDEIEVEAEYHVSALALPSVPVAEAQIAFQDYMDLGPTRSVAALRNFYLAKRQKDPHAPIPTTDVYILSQWESRYNWKALAWEHDADANRAFDQSRRNILNTLYDSQSKRSEKMIRIAEKAMGQLEADIDAGNIVLSPQDTLKFLQEGTKSLRESQEAMLKLQDPREQSEQGSSDFFDAIRKMGLLQINQQNNYYGEAS